MECPSKQEVKISPSRLKFQPKNPVKPIIKKICSKPKQWLSGSSEKSKTESKFERKQIDHAYENVLFDVESAVVAMESNLVAMDVAESKLKSVIENFDKILDEYGAKKESKIPKLQKSKTCSIIESKCILKKSQSVPFDEEIGKKQKGVSTCIIQAKTKSLHDLNNPELLDLSFYVSTTRKNKKTAETSVKVKEVVEKLNSLEQDITTTTTSMKTISRAVSCYDINSAAQKRNFQSKIPVISSSLNRTFPSTPSNLNRLECKKGSTTLNLLSKFEPTKTSSPDIRRTKPTRIYKSTSVQNLQGKLSVYSENRTKTTKTPSKTDQKSNGISRSNPHLSRVTKIVQNDSATKINQNSSKTSQRTTQNYQSASITNSNSNSVTKSTHNFRSESKTALNSRTIAESSKNTTQNGAKTTQNSETISKTINNSNHAHKTKISKNVSSVSVMNQNCSKTSQNTNGAPKTIQNSSSESKTAQNSKSVAKTSQNSHGVVGTSQNSNCQNVSGISENTSKIIQNSSKVSKTCQKFTQNHKPTSNPKITVKTTTRTVKTEDVLDNCLVRGKKLLSKIDQQIKQTQSNTFGTKKFDYEPKFMDKKTRLEELKLEVKTAKEIIENFSLNSCESLALPNSGCGRRRRADLKIEDVYHLNNDDVVRNEVVCTFAEIKHRYEMLVKKHIGKKDDDFGTYTEQKHKGYSSDENSDDSGNISNELELDGDDSGIVLSPKTIYSSNDSLGNVADERVDFKRDARKFDRVDEKQVKSFFSSALLSSSR